MQFESHVSEDVSVSHHGQKQQVMALLMLIERRTAYLMAEMQQAVELILNPEHQLMFGQDDFQYPISDLTIDQLERYAPQWATLVPNQAAVRSAMAHLLAQKYGLIHNEVPNIYQALALQNEAVKQAFEAQYGQPLASLFQVAGESDEARREKSKPSQEEEARDEVESLLEWVHLSTNDILFEQGEDGDSLYVMMHGRLRVIVEAEGVREVVRELGSGEIVGEMALITDEPRSATLQAVRDARLLKLTKANFEQLIVRHPQVMIQIARVLSKRVRLLSVRPPYSATLTTLAIIPASPDVPLAEFCQRFMAALSPYGSSLHLTSQRLEEQMQMGALSHDQNDGMIVAWLSEQETRYRFIIYESDRKLSSWSRRCLRQADHILIVGQANATPELGEIEQEMRQMSHVRKSLILLHPNGKQAPVGTSQWLAPRQVEQHYHLRWNMDRDMQRIARLFSGNGVGLVLSSGGATGLAHIGVIRALEEMGIPIDYIGGTSQGAWLAGLYAMGYDCQAMIKMTPEIVKKAGRPSYTLPLVSLFTGKTLSKALKMLFGQQHIEDLWLNYFCVSTNLTYGKAMVHNSGLLWKALRASSSIVGVMPPYIKDNQMFVDGATINTLPTDVMRQVMPNGLIFASNILPDLQNRAEELQQKEEYGETLSGWQVLWRRLNPFTKAINLPSIADLILLSVVLSNRNFATARKNVTDFQIDLDVTPYGTFDFHACEPLVEIGYRTAKKNIAEWKENGQWAAKGLL